MTQLSRQCKLHNFLAVDTFSYLIHTQAGVIPEVLRHKIVDNWKIKHEMFIVLLTDNAELYPSGSDLAVCLCFPAISGAKRVHLHVPLQKIQGGYFSRRRTQLQDDEGEIGHVCWYMQLVRYPNTHQRRWKYAKISNRMWVLRAEGHKAKNCSVWRRMWEIHCNFTNSFLRMQKLLSSWSLRTA